MVMMMVDDDRPTPLGYVRARSPYRPLLLVQHLLRLLLLHSALREKIENDYNKNHGDYAEDNAADYSSGCLCERGCIVYGVFCALFHFE
jgi:hypothetical protein